MVVEESKSHVIAIPMQYNLKQAEASLHPFFMTIPINEMECHIQLVFMSVANFSLKFNINLVSIILFIPKGASRASHPVDSFCII